MSSSSIALSTLREYQAMIVRNVSPSDHTLELLHLGFLPGIPVRVYSQGHPMVVDVGNTRVALDRNLASLILGESMAKDS